MRVSLEEKNINILILHRRSLIREELREFLKKEYPVYEAPHLRQALGLARSIAFSLVLAEASQGDFSSLAGIIPPDSALFLISSDLGELQRSLKSWPENRYVEIQPWPIEGEEKNIFAHRLERALSWVGQQPFAPPSPQVWVDNHRQKLAAEIKEIKNFLRRQVVKELEHRLSWEIKYLLAEQEKQKIQTILKKIYAADDVSSLLDSLSDIKEIIKAQSITFYVVDETEAQGKYLKPLVFEDSFLVHPDFARYLVPLQEDDFAAFVALRGEELNINNPKGDKRYSSRYKENLHHPLRHLLAVPVVREQKVIGVIEAYNKRGKERGGNGFNHEDRRLLKTISEHISLAMTKLNLIQYDALTGLLRPEPFFEKILQKVHYQSKRRVDIGHCAMAMGDVDWFKNYNDLHGHEAGNRLLRELANVLKSSVREEDLLCRYGGEEFLFFLFGVKNIEEACLLTDRIRRNVEEHYFLYQEDQPRKNLTMSFGVTIMPRELISISLTRENLKKLAAEADFALAEAKGKRMVGVNGVSKEEMPAKNRVCAYRHKESPLEGWTGLPHFNAEKFLEKRRHFRYFISTPLLILEDTGIKVTKTINLSQGGAKICLSSDLPVGQPLNLTIILEEKACQLKGNVIYQEKAAETPPLYQAGIEFSFPSPGVEKILADYLYTIESKSRAIN